MEHLGFSSFGLLYTTCYKHLKYIFIDSRERERETSIGCLLHASQPGLNPQPRYVPDQESNPLPFGLSVYGRMHRALSRTGWTVINIFVQIFVWTYTHGPFKWLYLLKTMQEAQAVVPALCLTIWVSLGEWLCCACNIYPQFLAMLWFRAATARHWMLFVSGWRVPEGEGGVLLSLCFSGRLFSLISLFPFGWRIWILTNSLEQEWKWVGSGDQS